MGSNIDAKTVYSVVAGIFVAGAIFWAIGKLPDSAITSPVKAAADAVK